MPASTPAPHGPQSVAPPVPDARPHRCLIPFASASDPACRALLPRLQVPHLDALLARLEPQPLATVGDHALSTPHERALALEQGLLGADGQAYGDGEIPWAAACSATPETPQAWFMPCHFQVGMEQVTLLPGDQVGLTEAESQALFAALSPFCAEDGITLRWDSATRWHASGEPLRGIACASLDRASGRPIDGWMLQGPANPAGAQLLRRLQSEAQMLFYTHAINDAREAARQPPINGFWITGAGAHHSSLAPAPAPAMPDALRQAALRADWSAWQHAWEAIDNTVVKALLDAARRGEPVALTLCGERASQRWVSPRAGAGARMGRFFKNLLGRKPAHQSLDTL
ncbi:MAG: phosphoglycerate mutase [Hydrogenophaga sp.]|nr:phosphoglycerate mutase [Hydrogenophaga sp.]